MSEIHMRHIKKVLQETFLPFVNIQDLERSLRQVPEHAKYSRALAAFALTICAGLEPEPACDYIVDGFQDNGVDAIFYDEEGRCVYLVQSKWMQNGGGREVGVGSTFIQGVRDVQRCRFDLFNERFRRHAKSLGRALDNPETRFELVLVSTSTQQPSVDCQRLLDEYQRGINDVSELVSWRSLGQAELYRVVSKTLDARPIDLEVMLHDWGTVAAPFRAFYGQVSVSDIAQWWQEHRHQLFSKNLRSFLGDSAVNDAIADTLKANPEQFWYLNNGLTILCAKIGKKPMGGGSRATGVFVCEGVAIVNGAQTVGTIGRTRGEGLGNAQVMVRIISLDKAQTDFANAVTRATNTQNRIEPRDFAALDEEQKRLRMELSVDGITYIYRSGEPSPGKDHGCTIEEATVALACAASDIQLAVQAKGNVGKLWADITRAPYTLLFNGGLTGDRLWRCVQILRRVETALDESRHGGIDIRRQLAVHGNRFVARQVFRTLQGNSTFDASDVEGLSIAVLDRLESGLDAVLKDTYIAWAFKTPSKCEALERQLFPNLHGDPIRPVSITEQRRRAAARSSTQLALFGNQDDRQSIESDSTLM